MKAFIGSFIVVLACLSFETSIAADQQHKEHHPEEKGMPMKAKGSGMMDMHEMMSQCMKMHNDEKMCGHQTMEECKAKMAHGECEKMMKAGPAPKKQKK
ncbi:hypothetical protein ACES2J_10740 [Bdellovibrio bacteriovorus]|uniref:hypothetical protein n=1 Tax=Bdellovibrio bacteriovorus TaxID=959 RepID=UPI0035A587B8